MVRTTVYLDAEDKRRLGALASATGTTEAELIRRGVRMVLSDTDRPRPRVGYGRSTDGRSAAETDAILADGFGAE